MNNTKQFQIGDTIVCVANRDVPITTGKLYTVIEYIPDYTDPESTHYTWPAHVVITNDDNKQSSYHAERFRKVER